MSVISTSAGYAATTMAVSEIEYQIKVVQDQIFMLTQQAQNAKDNPQMAEQLHNQELQLQQMQKQLEMEYQVMKTRLEGEEKMRKESITRAFKLNI